MYFKSFLKEFSLILFLNIVFASNIFADTIYLKSGDKIEGKIIQQKDNYLTIERPSDNPITLSIHEIASIESLQEVQEEAPVSDFHPFQENYGIKYDLSPLAPQFDPADLIIAIATLKTEIDIDIGGVIVLNTVEQDIARIVRTALLKKGDLLVEDSKYVLFISPDVAREPNQILRILRKEERKTPERIEKERIEMLKRGEIAKVFDGGGQNTQAKDKITSEMAKAPGRFIDFVSDLLNGKFRKKDPIEIDYYYLSFSQLFNHQN